MMRELVFIHGRAQQHKDSVALKAEWIEAFRKGLAKSGLDLPIPEISIRFPYYGDTLHELSSRRPPDQAAEVVVRGAAGAKDEQPDFILSVLNEMLAAAGIEDSAIAAEMDPDPAPVSRTPG